MFSTSRSTYKVWKNHNAWPSVNTKSWNCKNKLKIPLKLKQCLLIKYISWKTHFASKTERYHGTHSTCGLYPQLQLILHWSSIHKSHQEMPVHGFWNGHNCQVSDKCIDATFTINKQAYSLFLMPQELYKQQHC